ncbi:beta-N-acetylhexosaminidase [Ornithinibacillus sp. L9]|uniref:beta-N-acetylhexosaminidase n=1 Tax=Ornithinibacillus caprae TaxID=2678566 RepID=A0A6N8FIG8_9BACI|nr:beta-N-acetylhexosaminidase [Ornithinibacillus caprae]MUK89255.1 beta-N-acetylhexosaminidase [Ornithinibacillus caprae]
MRIKIKLSVILGILCILGMIVFGNVYKPTEQTYLFKTVPKSIHTPIMKENVPQLSHATIESIFQKAKEGRIKDVPIIAGETKIDQLVSLWGKSNHSAETNNRTYSEYSEHHITIGYSDSIIYDIRSYHEELSQIHMKDILTIKGEPDEERYYKDEQYDQVILVYRIGESYDLKWVLPKPTESIPNPTVHHISLVSHQNVSDQDYLSQIETMTLDEKIGQMVIAGISGTEITTDTKELIQDYKVGGFIFYPKNLTTVEQTKKLINEIKAENASNDIPLFLSVDQEGGRINRLPGNLEKLPTNEEIGDIHDVELSYKIGVILGKQLTEFGMNLNFAPVLDTNSNPNNPVINNRSFGNNPDIVSELGIQTMKGIQSQNIISVVKHFPGHGDTSVDSHLELPIVDKHIQELHELELKPFIHAIRNGADVVMVAHILLTKIDSQYPASLSKNIMSDILREELNFDGVIITDDMTMDAIENNYELGDAAVQSIHAGSDILLVAHEYQNVVNTINSIKQVVKKGIITEERINESVTRILELKQNYTIDHQQINTIEIEKLNKLIRKTLP